MDCSATIAVAVAKSDFEVAMSTQPGRVSERHRLTRTKFEQFFHGRAQATVAMEACGRLHFCDLTHSGPSNVAFSCGRPRIRSRRDSCRAARQLLREVMLPRSMSRGHRESRERCPRRSAT